MIYPLNRKGEQSWIKSHISSTYFACVLTALWKPICLKCWQDFAPAMIINRSVITWGTWVEYSDDSLKAKCTGEFAVFTLGFRAGKCVSLDSTKFTFRKRTTETTEACSCWHVVCQGSIAMRNKICILCMLISKTQRKTTFKIFMLFQCNNKEQAFLITYFRDLEIRGKRMSINFSSNTHTACL